MKKTGKSKAAKSEKQEEVREGRNLDPAEIREKISALVRAEAGTMAEAVINGNNGQLATVKYLWELAKIFPAPPEESRVTEEEDCLAKTLLDRLNILKKAGDDEDEAMVNPPEPIFPPTRTWNPEYKVP